MLLLSILIFIAGLYPRGFSDLMIKCIMIINNKALITILYALAYYYFLHFNNYYF